MAALSRPNGVTGARIWMNVDARASIGDDGAVRLSGEVQRTFRSAGHSGLHGQQLFVASGARQKTALGRFWKPTVAAVSAPASRGPDRSRFAARRLRAQGGGLDTKGRRSSNAQLPVSGADAHMSDHRRPCCLEGAVWPRKPLAAGRAC